MNDPVKILIVDDDPDVLFATTRVVKSDGYSVLNASSGEECIEQTRQHMPDLILLDVLLPDIIGTEVCSRIKSDPSLSGIYIILISGKMISAEKQSAGLDIGADGYIIRPVSNRELLARINAMVRIIKLERERNELIKELQDALSKVKTLEGLLPICAYCKKIRDDKGYWNRIEKYIAERTDAQFSHGICKDCLKKLRPHMKQYDE